MNIARVRAAVDVGVRMLPDRATLGEANWAQAQPNPLTQYRYVQAYSSFIATTADI